MIIFKSNLSVSLSFIDVLKKSHDMFYNMSINSDKEEFICIKPI